MKTILVTGSSGLIGSEVCRLFNQNGFAVHGLDNNQRATFFGPGGDTRGVQQQLINSLHNFTHHELDIRNRARVLALIKTLTPSAIVHAAAQPSHDLAAHIPFDDFDTNAVGTLNLLEGVRQYCPESPFIFLSTNKVYGDGPNRISLKELATRWEYDDSAYECGIAEDFPVDQCTHSLFGASKMSADILVQEYGRYFGLPTCCLRGGCLTGPNHAGVELHGFLNYLARCNVENRPYTIFGHKGKQVRDSIHAWDVANFIYIFCEAPRVAEVYNIGGGRSNTCSVLEAFDMVEKYSGKKSIYTYHNTPRIGDHICYYSDLTKIKSHYPIWDITRNIDDTIRAIVKGVQLKKINTI